jgi:lysozyme
MINELDMTKLQQNLQADEGFMKSAYQDHLGFWTIGIGTLIDERKNAGITLDEANYLLRNRINKNLKELDSRIPWWREHPEHVQRALANMAYQLGPDGLLNFKDTLALIKAGKYSQAAGEALKSLWAKQTPSRAKKVTDLMRGRVLR